MKKRLLAIICAVAVMFSGVANFTYRRTHADESQVIPIAMALDNNFVLPTVVAITSMLETAKEDTFYKYYLMVSGDFTNENTQKILSLKKKYTSKCDFIFIDMGMAYQENRTLKHITAPTYYRLRIQDIINEKKVIYLDGDIVVNQDLSELFNENVEKHYLAGVLSSSTVFLRKDYAKKLDVPDMKRYINAGVLLMNLERMRIDAMGKHFSNFVPLLVERGLTLDDQDAINSCCYNGIKVISFKYNMLNQYPVLDDSAYDNNYWLRGYSQKEWDEGRRKPVVIHYSSPQKPWKASDISYGYLWWEYAKKTDYYNEIKEWSSQLRANMRTQNNQKKTNSSQVKNTHQFRLRRVA